MSKNKPVSINEWKKAIIKACKENGTFQKTDEQIVNILSEIMAKRSMVEEKFEQTGGNPVVTHTNKGGNKNLVKNPFLVTWIDLTNLALPYWRDLGLTPSARKKITGESGAPKTTNALAEALKGL